MEQKVNTVTLTTQELLKLTDPETAFKSSNWIEWLEDIKDKRRHNRIVFAYGCATTILLALIFLGAGYIKLIPKDAVNTLLGSLIATGATIFITFIKKTDKQK